MTTEQLVDALIAAARQSGIRATWNLPDDMPTIRAALLARVAALETVARDSDELTSAWRGEGNGRVSCWSDDWDQLLASLRDLARVVKEQSA